MRSISVRMFACVLAVAVAFNGAMLRSALSALAYEGQGSYSARIEGMTTYAGSSSGQAASNLSLRHPTAHEFAAHRHNAPDIVPPLAAHDHIAAHDHTEGGAKCCSMCLVMAHAMPTCSASPVTFSYATIHFALARQTLAGNLVPLDPDIPKSHL